MRNLQRARLSMFATFNGAGCTVSRRTPVLRKGGEW